MNRQVSFIIAVVVTLLLLAYALVCHLTGSAMTSYATTVAVLALIGTVSGLVICGKQIAEDGPIW